MAVWFLIYKTLYSQSGKALNGNFYSQSFRFQLYNYDTAPTPMKSFQLGEVSFTTIQILILIRKRIFRFFAKIQKRRWVLCIISKTGYFGYMNRSVSFRIPKQWILPALTWNNFNTNINCFTLIIFMAILNPRHGLNNRFYPFYRHGKIAMQTGPALTVLVYKDKTAKQLRRRVLQDFIFPVASLFARPLWPV